MASNPNSNPTKDTRQRSKSISKATMGKIQAGDQTINARILTGPAAYIGPGAGGQNIGRRAGSINDIEKDGEVTINAVKPEGKDIIFKGPGVGADNSGEESGSVNKIRGKFQM